jgi:hypothetical protein
MRSESTRSTRSAPVGKQRKERERSFLAEQYLFLLHEVEDAKNTSQSLAAELTRLTDRVWALEHPDA